MGRIALGIAAGAAVVAGVLGSEMALARRGAMAPSPAGLDGCIGCAASPAPPLRMVWLGDSTAAGVGASSADAALPRQVAARLRRPVELSVLARSGARLADVVDDQLPRLAALRPELVVVSVGANDAVHLTGAGAFRRRWRRLSAGASGSRLVVLGIPDMGSPPRMAQPLRALVAWWARRLNRSGAPALAAGGAATYVDIAARTGPELRRHPDRYFARDRYHPGDAGYRLWADAVLERLG